MESVKDEGSLGSSGLAMVGSKEPLFSRLQSAREERGKEKRERRGGEGERKERSYWSKMSSWLGN